MITFGTITRRNTQVNFTIEAIDGYKVVGSATYNKENKLIDASGTISTPDGSMIGSFSIYGEVGDMRVNLNDCIADKMNDVVDVAKETLTSLADTYPQI